MCVFVCYRVARRGLLIIGNAPLCPVQGLLPERMGSNGSCAGGSHDEHLRTGSSQVRDVKQVWTNVTPAVSSNIALSLPNTWQGRGEYSCKRSNCLCVRRNCDKVLNMGKGRGEDRLEARPQRVSRWPNTWLLAGVYYCTNVLIGQLECRSKQSVMCLVHVQQCWSYRIFESSKIWTYRQ
jgi:hypothetical protein